jgi:Tfp pilus assembly protein PilF
LKDKNYVAAESRLKEALEIKPDSPAALIGLAQAQQKLGKSDAARQNYEAYLKLNPDGPDADKVKKALAQLK